MENRVNCVVFPELFRLLDKINAFNNANNGLETNKLQSCWCCLMGSRKRRCGTEEMPDNEQTEMRKSLADNYKTIFIVGVHEIFQNFPATLWGSN